MASVHLPLPASWLEINVVATAASVLPLVHCFARNHVNVLFGSCDSVNFPAARFLRLALGIFYSESAASGILPVRLCVALFSSDYSQYIASRWSICAEWLSWAQ